MTAIYPDPDATLQGGYNGDSHAEMHGRTLEAWENVKAHGAVGSGATDDAAAIQAAIDACPADNGYVVATGSVYVPPGIYQIGTTITLRNGVSLRGAGIGSVFVNIMGDDSPMVRVACNDSTIEDMHFYGTSAYSVNSTGPAIFLGAYNGGSGHTNNTVRRCWFRYIEGVATYAIDSLWAMESRIENCRFHGCEGGGIRLGSTSNGSTIRDNTISNGMGALGGIYVGAGGTLIENNVIEGWRGEFGIRVGDIGSVTILRNWLEDNNGRMIDVLPGSYNITIQGNNTSGNGSTTAGFYLDQTTNFVMSGNYTSSGGVYLVSGASANQQTTGVMMGNQITGATGGVIDMSGLVNVKDTVVRMGERRDSFGNAYHGVEVAKGHVRMGSDSSLGWKPSEDAEMDTWLYRAGVAHMKTNQKLQVGGEVELDGALNHDGTTVGFYGTTPIVKQTGVAVSAAGVHAALVNLGLISA